MVAVPVTQLPDALPDALGDAGHEEHPNAKAGPDSDEQAAVAPHEAAPKAWQLQKSSDKE